jgi:hypothetical protein
MLAQMASSVEVTKDRGVIGVVVGVLVPAAVATAAFVLWRISDALLLIGPLDRAQFGWTVVIPVWLATPIVAAFLWRNLTSAQATQAAIGLNLLIAVIAAWLLWRSAVDGGQSCQFGSAFSPETRAVQSAWIGLLIGLDPALAGLVARRFAVRGAVWRTIAVGIGVGFALFWVAVLFGAAIGNSSLGCNRPPAG